MKSAVLILYFVVNGHMSTVRIPQADLGACEAAAPAMAAALKPMHSECKEKTVKAKKTT